MKITVISCRFLLRSSLVLLFRQYSWLPFLLDQIAPIVFHSLYCAFDDLPSCSQHSKGPFEILLTNSNLLNFASIQENDAEDKKEDGDEVLPPMTLTIALEQNTQVTKSEMVK